MHRKCEQKQSNVHKILTLDNSVENNSEKSFEIYTLLRWMGFPLIPHITIYDEYIALPKLTEQKKTI